jgi:hypothetical protein
MLNSAECPLSGETLQRAKRNYTYVQARGIFRMVRRRRFKSAIDFIKYGGLGISDWIKYLRPPKRSADAGTPAQRRGVPTC